MRWIDESGDRISTMAQRYLTDPVFHARVHTIVSIHQAAFPDAKRRDLIDAAIMSVCVLETIQPGPHAV